METSVGASLRIMGGRTPGSALAQGICRNFAAWVQGMAVCRAAVVRLNAPFPALVVRAYLPPGPGSAGT